MSQNTADPALDARSTILQRIVDDMDTLARHQELPQPIINIHGAPGIGKTSLLRRVRERCAEAYPVVIWDAASGDSTKPTGPAHPLRRLLAALRAYSQRDSAGRPLLLLLDNLNNIPFWKQVQEQVIKPLLRRDDVLIVCASMAPLFWHFWEIRERCATLQLYAFSEAETEDFLRGYDRELLAHAAYKLTLGYPWALVQLVRRLDDDLDEAEPRPDEPFDLDNLSPDTRVIAMVVGLVRLVDVPLLERMLLHFRPKSGTQNTRSKLYAALAELRSQHLFYPYRRDRQAYRLRRALRHAVAAQLCINGRKRYLTFCGYLVQAYQEQLREQPITGVAALIEWIYFSTEPLTAAAAAGWLQEARELFAISNLDMPAVVALLHEDSEVLSKLRTAGLLEDVKAIIREHLDDTAEIPLGLEFRFSRDALVRPLFNDITTSVPIQGVQKYIDDLLRLIAQAGGPFNAAWLHEELNHHADAALPVTSRHIDDILTLLNLRGFLVYDPKLLSYSADPNQLVRTLTVPQPTAKTPDAHISEKTEHQEKRA
jgi:hypothetical protein